MYVKPSYILGSDLSDGVNATLTEDADAPTAPPMVVNSRVPCSKWT